MPSSVLRNVEDTITEKTDISRGQLLEAERRVRCVGKGVAAGLIGGLIGTIVMNDFQKAWSKTSQALKSDEQQQQQQGSEESENATMKAAGKIVQMTGHQLNHEQKKKAGPVVHYSFGTLQGAVYGAVTELTGTPGGFLPALLFGATLFALADEVAVPALGLGGKPGETPVSMHLYGAAAHCVYGLATEMARRGLRAAL